MAQKFYFYYFNGVINAGYRTCTNWFRPSTRHLMFLFSFSFIRLLKCLPFPHSFILSSLLMHNPLAPPLTASAPKVPVGTRILNASCSCAFFFFFWFKTSILVFTWKHSSLSLGSLPLSVPGLPVGISVWQSVNKNVEQRAVNRSDLQNRSVVTNGFRCRDTGCCKNKSA